MNRRITALTIAAVAVLGLTVVHRRALDGCEGPTVRATAQRLGLTGAGGVRRLRVRTPIPAPAGTRPASRDACAVIGQAITDATAGMEGVEPSDDPQAAIDAMNASAEAIGAAIADIDNEEVAAAAKGMQEGFAGIAEATEAVMDGDVVEGRGAGGP